MSPPPREAEAQTGHTVPSIRAGVNTPLGVRRPHSTHWVGRLTTCSLRPAKLHMPGTPVFSGHRAESSRHPPSCARARRKGLRGLSTLVPLRASPGPMRSRPPFPVKPHTSPFPGSSAGGTALGKLVRDRNSAGSVPRGDSPLCPSKPPHSLPGPVLGGWGHRNRCDPAAPDRPDGQRDSNHSGTSAPRGRGVGGAESTDASLGSTGSLRRVTSPGCAQQVPCAWNLGRWWCAGGTGQASVCKHSPSCLCLGFAVGRRPSPCSWLSLNFPICRPEAQGCGWASTGRQESPHVCRPGLQLCGGKPLSLASVPRWKRPRPHAQGNRRPESCKS